MTNVTEWGLNSFVKPINPEERNYAIFGNKLLNQDLIIFKQYKDEYLTKLKKVNLFFRPLIVVTIILAMIAIFISEEYWNFFKLSVSILFLLISIIYIVIFIPYYWIGIYARSWIKLLELREAMSKLTFFQKINFSAILYPAIKSYLEVNNISLFITKDEISTFTRKSKNLDKIIQEHLIFDNSVINFDGDNGWKIHDQRDQIDSVDSNISQSLE